MKNKGVLLGICGLLMAFNVINAHAASDTYTYNLYDNETDRNLIAETVVKIKELSKDQISLTRQKPADECTTDDTFILDSDYAAVKWERKCEEDGTNITAERVDDVFVIKGTLKGKEIEKEIVLGGSFLYIYPEYSLSKFAFSDLKVLKFWTLRRDDLTRLPMQAIQKGEETIIVDGKEVQAIKVYYSITGKLREKYYNHNYYYRKSDGALIKREEQNGRIEELVKEK